MFTAEGLEAALHALGELLDDRGESFSVVAVGGGALALMGLIERATEDIDLVALTGNNALETAQPLPASLARAIVDVADVHQLPHKWMNPGPTSLLRFGLPEGFLERCEVRTYGALTLSLASRWDQIHLKVYAAADEYHGGPHRGKHHRDLERLKPTHDELRAAIAWTRTHDPSEGFLIQLEGALKPFGLEPENG